MEIIEQSLKHIWFPCSQMKDYEKFPPLMIKKAKGSYLFLNNGQRIIDAISSWWCKSLGHAHPRLQEALIRQMNKFEHVIFADTTHSIIAELSQALGTLSPSLTRVFYASDGSSATEIAMKMSLHAHIHQGEKKRQRFISLKNGYHGETTGALSVSDLGLYREPYQAILFEPIFIDNIPYVSGRNDPLWNDCSAIWPNIEKQLDPYRLEATAIILEPIVQGAAGMQIYSPDFLRRLRKWTLENKVHLIADEIMTGLGRTGLPLACQHAEIEPDFLCLSKGLTAGWLPLSAVCTSESVFHLFYDDYESAKGFMHSHTHSGNALAASVALETLKILAEENIYEKAQILEKVLLEKMQEVAIETKKITNIRALGAIVAADLIPSVGLKRKGFAVYQKAIELGALLRPIGNTLYWLPPLNIEEKILNDLQEITIQAINSA